MAHNDHPGTAFDRFGTVAKVHGLRGELVIRTDLPKPKQLDRLELVYINDGRGMMQPFRIESGRISTLGNRQQFFVMLETVADRNAASTLMGREVFAPAGVLDLFVDEDEDDMAGYSVFSTDGTQVGTVIGVIENPAHPLLQVKVAGKGAILIPLVDAYVGEIDDEGRTVTVHDIDELMEL